MQKLLASVSLALAVRSTLGVAVWGQCGGTGYSGSTVCDAGSTCTYSNPYYSQCLPSTGGGGTTSSTATSTATSSAPTGTGTSAAGDGPCDIYASGGTACVAAHSTTRALYKSYSGALYQVTRANGGTTDIHPLAAGGVANAATQDSYCSGTTCTISIIYDQSGRGNHLTRAPKGYSISGPGPGGADNLASATGAPVTLNGQKAYGVFIPPGTGYRNDKVSGTATGNGAEGIYAVLDGTHYNGGCCFDYGNAETNNGDTGAGHMEAVYFGNIKVWGYGSGNGPWIMADLENGLFSGQNARQNTGDPTVNYRFTTAMVKGQPNNLVLRGGNAASGSLSTFYNGVRPNGYNPMHLEGAIILGIGGDNSNGAQGTFYEGVMTSGFPSDATEAAVQANIVAAKYSTGKLSTTELPVGEKISLRATNPGEASRYISHSGATINTQAITSANSTTAKQQASWVVLTGLARSDCYSFESVDSPGRFIRHSDFELRLERHDGSKEFSEDATFCSEPALNGQGHTIRSWNHPTRFFRDFNGVGYTSSNDGVHSFDTLDGFHDDVSFIADSSFA